MFKTIMKAINQTVEGGQAIETETTKELLLDSPIKRAKINIHNGKITLRQWDRQEVKAYVQVRATGDYAEQAGEEKNTDQFWSLHQTGTGIVFEQLSLKKFPLIGSLHINVELFVPSLLEAQVHTHNGMIDISDFKGDVDAQTHNGDLLLETITGNIEVQTHNGNIDINGLQGNLRMETHNGHLRAESVTGRVKGQTHNGKIFLENSGQPGMSLETHNGSIRIKTKQEIAGEWNLTTHSGNVEVSLPSTTSAVLTMKTSSGRIWGTALQMETDRNSKKLITTLASGQHPVHIETHSGDIEVQFVD